MTSDDAGGGRRGLRATSSPELFDALHKYYQIAAGNNAVDLGGSSSLNLLVLDNESRYVVRVYRPYVTDARLELINRVRRTLTVQGVPCPKIVETVDGQLSIRFAGRLVEVERYVEHDGNMDSWERLKLGLPLLGRLHTILGTLSVSGDAHKPLFANHIEPGEALTKTLQGTARIRAWNPAPETLRLADAADDLAHRLHTADELLVAQLPRQLTHGDYWDNNVLFQGERVVLISDLDFMSERARIDDLALTLYFALISLTSTLDFGSENQLRKLRELVTAYNSELNPPLSRVERAALPFAIARQPLWSVGGWIAQLDDEASARQHAAGMGGEVKLALQIIQEIDRWQAALA